MHVRNAVGVLACRVVNPAGLTSYGDSMTLAPVWSIFTSDEAVISSNIMP
jgi:hypothetical protein